MTTTTVVRPRWSDLKPNKKMFVAVLAHIEEFPEHHNQGPWRCNTGMCFGGWSTQIAGFQWKTKTARTADVVLPLTIIPRPDLGERDPVKGIGPDGLAVVYAQEAAMIALGISHDNTSTDDGDWIFAGDNTLDKLYEISAEILCISERALRRNVKKYRREHQLRDYVKKPKLLTRVVRWRASRG